MASRGGEVARVLTRRWAGALVASHFGLTRGSTRRAAFARATRLAFEDLGPAFIKIGQLVSVRPDVFSSELVFEMSALRDSVPSIPFKEIAAVLERESGRPSEEVFEALDPRPIASASIAQVYEARLTEAARPAWGDPLPAGSRVAVKIVRPGVAESIAADLALARRLARRCRWLPGLRRVDMQGFFDEFEASLGRETDMREEGRTADRFAFDFRHDDLIRVPRVVWRHTSESVLTMEYLEGWRLSELDPAARAGVDGEGLARHGAVAFMRQVLVHGRFHADLHPANLFVTPGGQIAYLDFGIVGHLSRQERACVGEVLNAIVERDPERALDASVALGLHVQPTRRAALVRDLDTLMERTLGHDRDVRHFGMGLLSLLARHRVKIPMGYGLLVKALVTVEGVARALYPGIDIIETARPFARTLGSTRGLYSSVRGSLRLPVR